MASGPSTSWQIEGEKVEAVTDFLFLGSKIIVDGDCSHEIRRCLLPGGKAMTNLDSVLKSKDITLPTKVHIVKAIVKVFPVVMYRCESWTIKKAECQQIDVVLEKALPWTESWSNQLILKEINPEYSLEGLELKSFWSWSSNTLTTWCKVQSHWKRTWCWERLKAKVERRWQRLRWLDSIIDSMDMNLI